MIAILVPMVQQPAQSLQRRSLASHQGRAHQSGSISVSTRILCSIIRPNYQRMIRKTDKVFFVSSISWKTTQPVRGLRVNITEVG